MQKKQILKCVLVVAGLGLAQAASAQAAPSPSPTGGPAAAAASTAAVVPVQSYTLGDLADMARDLEFEKQRRALREAKGVVEVKAPAPVPLPVKKKVKAPPKPIEPEGLQVRAIFGMPRSETVRFFTNKGQFEDHHVGETVQGWTIIQVADEGVVLQKGKVIYPLALRTLRMAPESADGGESEPLARNAVQAGPLPSPKLVSGQ
ncbi:hypothetical protein [Massilia orientalis]|uniref:Uncharacterized protein n=1 Tax=Massilia orientalis TaxID=3050128 RepID=A0ACC7MKB4_9BURK|nr:hypothetical protein [Massilia sp. YIM B02787]